MKASFHITLMAGTEPAMQRKVCSASFRRHYPVQVMRVRLAPFSALVAPLACLYNFVTIGSIARAGRIVKRSFRISMHTISLSGAVYEMISVPGKTFCEAAGIFQADDTMAERADGTR